MCMDLWEVSSSLSTVLVNMQAYVHGSVKNSMAGLTAKETFTANSQPTSYSPMSACTGMCPLSKLAQDLLCHSI